MTPIRAALIVAVFFSVFGSTGVAHAEKRGHKAVPEAPESQSSSPDQTNKNPREELAQDLLVFFSSAESISDYFLELIPQAPLRAKWDKAIAAYINRPIGGDEELKAASNPVFQKQIVPLVRALPLRAEKLSFLQRKFRISDEERERITGEFDELIRRQGFILKEAAAPAKTANPYAWAPPPPPPVKAESLQDILNGGSAKPELKAEAPPQAPVPSPDEVLTQAHKDLEKALDKIDEVRPRLLENDYSFQEAHGQDISELYDQQKVVAERVEQLLKLGEHLVIDKRIDKVLHPDLIPENSLPSQYRFLMKLQTLRGVTWGKNTERDYLTFDTIDAGERGFLNAVTFGEYKGEQSKLRERWNALLDKFENVESTEGYTAALSWVRLNSKEIQSMIEKLDLNAMELEAARRIAFQKRDGAPDADLGDYHGNRLRYKVQYVYGELKSLVGPWDHEDPNSVCSRVARGVVRRGELRGTDLAQALLGSEYSPFYDELILGKVAPLRHKPVVRAVLGNLKRIEGNPAAQTPAVIQAWIPQLFHLSDNEYEAALREIALMGLAAPDSKFHEQLREELRSYWFNHVVSFIGGKPSSDFGKGPPCDPDGSKLKAALEAPKENWGTIFPTTQFIPDDSWTAFSKKGSLNPQARIETTMGRLDAVSKDLLTYFETRCPAEFMNARRNPVFKAPEPKPVRLEPVFIEVKKKREKGG